ncbi:MAG: fluoride efflux transporter CrcB [Pyrinomonadaceae bacterium]
METTTKIIFVGVGGALGAVGRYLINISPLANVSDKFPLPTFVINITGSFLIGFLFVMFTERVEVSENIRLALAVGFLGAFTTFSAFELEIFMLMRDRQVLTAFAYLALSVFTGFIGVLAGVALGRRI